MKIKANILDADLVPGFSENELTIYVGGNVDEDDRFTSINLDLDDYHILSSENRQAHLGIPVVLEIKLLRRVPLPGSFTVRPAQDNTQRIVDPTL